MRHFLFSHYDLKEDTVELDSYVTMPSFVFISVRETNDGYLQDKGVFQ